MMMMMIAQGPRWNQRARKQAAESSFPKMPISTRKRLKGKRVWILAFSPFQAQSLPRFTCRKRKFSGLTQRTQESSRLRINVFFGLEEHSRARGPEWSHTMQVNDDVNGHPCLPCLTHSFTHTGTRTGTQTKHKGVDLIFKLNEQEANRETKAWICLQAKRIHHTYDSGFVSRPEHTHTITKKASWFNALNLLELCCAFSTFPLVKLEHFLEIHLF